MMQAIHISEQLFARLQAHGVPFVDQPEDVIARLLAFYEKANPSGTASIPKAYERAPRRVDGQKVGGRQPRERGVRAQIGSRVLNAASVADLYQQALTLLVDDLPSRLTALVPFSTSKERYLVATKPVHPNGAAFVRPVQHRGLYMESHKDYKNAISHLGKLVDKCGLPFRHLGS